MKSVVLVLLLAVCDCQQTTMLESESTCDVLLLQRDLYLREELHTSKEQLKSVIGKGSYGVISPPILTREVVSEFIT